MAEFTRFYNTSPEDLDPEAVRQYELYLLHEKKLSPESDHAGRIDVGDLQGHGFGNAQAGAAAGHQRRAIFQAGHMPEDALDFLRAEW